MPLTQPSPHRFACPWNPTRACGASASEAEASIIENDDWAFEIHEPAVCDRCRNVTR